MAGGPEARRTPLRALRRGAAVFGLLTTGLFGFGLTGASAQTVPCILVVCLPTPTPLPTLPLPLPTVSLPVATAPLSVPTVSSPLSTSTVTVPTLPSITGAAPTPTPSDPLNGVVGSSSSPCSVSVAGVCVLSSAPSPSPPTPPACLGSTDPTCLINPSSPSGNPDGGGGRGPGGGSGGSGGPGSANQALPTGTFSAFGGGGLSGTDPTAGGAAAIPLGLRVATIPALDQLGPASGFQFGHALILWPLFGLLDVLGLAAVYLVVRRLRATRSD